MIELIDDQLAFSFPKVHPQASLQIDFQRTLRIPDDDKSYPLPPGLGRFPLRHVDDFRDNVPASWHEHGGIMLPMFQSEALWIHFRTWHDPDRQASYPFAIKVATGKIDAITGKPWVNGLHRNAQDYMVAPTQPWLDGYCVEKGVIRQFVAMPLGTGYSAEEQITGKAEHGGLQIGVYPMKREAYERRFPIRPRVEREFFIGGVMSRARAGAPAMEMGLAAGGRMKQEIFADPFDFDDWDTTQSSRCFVHIANSLAWRAITGSIPPTIPPTAKQYSKHGLPWFDYYDDKASVAGSEILAKLKSVFATGKTKGEQPLPENEGCEPQTTVVIVPSSKHRVREGAF